MWKVNCLTTGIEKIMACHAGRHGWEGSGIKYNQYIDYVCLGVLENGEMNAWTDPDSYPDLETISIEEAYCRLKAGPPKPDVDFHLTYKEAQVIMTLCGRTTGNNHSSPREDSEVLFNRLYGMGIKSISNLISDPNLVIHFNDYDEEKKNDEK